MNFKKTAAGVLALCMITGALPTQSIKLSVKPVVSYAEDEEDVKTFESLYYKVVDDEVVITGCKDSAKDIVIPETIDGKDVTEIADDAFAGKIALKSVSLPDCITKIGDRAFQGCVSLKEIFLPEDLLSLGKYAFENCSGLVSAWFLFGPTYIPEGAFKNCGALKEVHFSAALTEFYVNNYYDAGKRSTDVFYGCSIEDVYYAGTFEQWKAITNNVATLYSHSITCNQTSARVRTYENLKYVINEDDTVSIVGVVKDEKEVFIPSEIDGRTVSAIYSNAFRDSSKLETITVSEGVVVINPYAFENCAKLKNVSLPESLGVIDVNAFNKCISLKEIYIPSAVSAIYGSAFNGCTSLESVYLPEELTVLGTYAFENCANLKTLYIPGGPSYIPEGAFKNCGALKDVYFSTSITEFYVNNYYDAGKRSTDVFYGCTLQNVYYAGTEEQWKSIENRVAATAVAAEITYDTPVPSRETKPAQTTPTTTTTTTTTTTVTTTKQTQTMTTTTQSLCTSTPQTTTATTTATPTPTEDLYGDVNGDGVVDGRDATIILIDYAERCRGGESSLTEKQKLLANVDKSDIVDAIDAGIIMKCYAENLLGVENPTLDIEENFEIIENVPVPSLSVLDVTNGFTAAEIGVSECKPEFKINTSVDSSEKTITVTILLDGDNVGNYSTMGFVLEFDKSLSVVNNSWGDPVYEYGSAVKRFFSEVKTEGNKVSVACNGSGDRGLTGEIVTLKFNYDKDGTYNFRINPVDGSLFTDKDDSPTGRLKQAYLFTKGLASETVKIGTGGTTICGDANCDGAVNIADATAIIQSIANADKYGLSEQGAKNADCDGEAGITPLDAYAIQKLEAGMIDRLPEK